MRVIATAGHVDHGKSTLVQRLTGIDPDRLEEEKRRGLTIDLGFAWLTLPSGGEIGVVDVPGHERFIRNMLAGVGSVDAVLFVVAANEGWKPQSQEHLDILDLLGVSSGVVALTKADLATADEIRGRTLEVRERLSATSLSGAPVVPVSAATGEGIESLLERLDAAVASSPARTDAGRPRLHVDRVFTMHGSGTVLTGTLEGGQLSEQNEVVILPAGHRARIRSIQTHKKKVARAEPGSRAALNLVGLELTSVNRGDVVSLPGMWEPTSRLVAEIRFLPHLSHNPTERGAYKFYLGASEHDARLKFLGPPPARGGSVNALITTSGLVIADWNDRFVLREAGRRQTVGGGTVLEPHAKEVRLAEAANVARAGASARTRQDYASSVVEEAGVISSSSLRRRTGTDASDLEDVLVLPTYAVASRLVDEIVSVVSQTLGDHHRKNPLEPGMPVEQLRGLVRPLMEHEEAFDQQLAWLQGTGRIARDGPTVRLPDHRPAVDDSESSRLIDQLVEHGSSPPFLEDLQRQFDPAVVKALIRSGRLVQISPTIVYPESWVEELKQQLRQRVEEQGPFTVAAFRDLIGTTRKYAVPLVEYLDSIGFTRREGDHRVLGPKA